MDITLKNKMLYSNKIYHNLENKKRQLKPLFRDVVNNLEFREIDSFKTKKINLKLDYDNISLENYYLIASEYNKQIDYLRQNLLSYFIPSNIAKDIFKKFVYYNLIEFNYKNRIIRLHLFNNNINYDYRILTTIIAKGFTFLEYANIDRKDIEFFYIPTKFRKEFPKNKIIGPNNVNSAFTSFNHDGTGNRIVIFREEEASKVFIHELVHYVNLDFSQKNLSYFNKLIENSFCIEKNNKFINLFEAYTDSIAIIYNCVLNSIILDTSVSNLFGDEINYQYRLLSNILKFNKMTHILKSKNNKNILLQKSNVLSYYFIKYGLILDPKYFLSNFDLNTIWTENKILEIYNLSKNVLKNTTFDFNNRSKYNKSLRMTYNNINVI